MKLLNGVVHALEGRNICRRYDDLLVEQNLTSEQLYDRVSELLYEAKQLNEQAGEEILDVQEMRMSYEILVNDSKYRQ